MKTEWLLRQTRPEESGCRIWTGDLSDKGYARIKVDGVPKRVSRMILANKLGRALFPGENACHTCDTPACIAPDHLFSGTQLGNMIDAKAKDRHTRGERQREARLTAAQVGEIRISTATGLSLSEKYKVTPPTISKIRRGRTWTHLK